MAVSTAKCDYNICIKKTSRKNPDCETSKLVQWHIRQKARDPEKCKVDVQRRRFEKSYSQPVNNLLNALRSACLITHTLKETSWMNTTSLVDQEGGCRLIGCTNYFSYGDLSEFAMTKGYCSKRRSFESFYRSQLTSSEYQLVYLVHCVHSLSKKRHVQSAYEHVIKG